MLASTPALSRPNLVPDPVTAYAAVRRNLFFPPLHWIFIAVQESAAIFRAASKIAARVLAFSAPGIRTWGTRGSI